MAIKATSSPAQMVAVAGAVRVTPLMLLVNIAAGGLSTEICTTLLNASQAKPEPSVLIVLRLKKVSVFKAEVGV